MNTQPDNRRRKPLVTVEYQTEIDIATGGREQRMFVKMYFEARDSGLLAALPDDLWKTLCCIATYMDDLGTCCPSQTLLAEYLGVSRQIVNKRINRLLAFRFQGEPIISMTKSRESKKGGSRWANNVYVLRPIAGFGMFDGKNEYNKSLPAPEIPKNPSNMVKTSMSTKVDIEAPGSSPGHPEPPQTEALCQHAGDTEALETRALCQPLCKPLCQPVVDTNQIKQEETNNVNVNAFRKSLPERHSANASLSAEEEIRRGSLIGEMLEVCRDKHSRGFYRLVAERVPEELIRAALSETKYQDRMGRITKSRGAFFTDQLQRIAKQRGVELGLNLHARASKVANQQSP